MTPSEGQVTRFWAGTWEKEEEKDGGGEREHPFNLLIPLSCDKLQQGGGGRLKALCSVLLTQREEERERERREN